MCDQNFLQVMYWELDIISLCYRNGGWIDWHVLGARESRLSSHSLIPRNTQPPTRQPKVKVKFCKTLINHHTKNTCVRVCVCVCVCAGGCSYI